VEGAADILQFAPIQELTPPCASLERRDLNYMIGIGGKVKGALAVLFLLASTGAAHAAADGASGVSPYAYQVTEFLGLPITNSIVTSWIFSLIIILAFRAIAKKPQLIPTVGQAVAETLILSVRDIVEPIVGKRMIKVTFPLLIGYFTFILIHNWSGLIPGVGTFGFSEHGHFNYWYRPANADLNMTLALALVSFAAWLYFIFKYAGLKVILFDLFGNKADKNEVPAPLYAFLFLIFIVVGVIETISIIFRPVSLSFRLFGNMYGGENLLTSMTGLVSYIVPVPFYFLEILIGLVQALVFTMLVAVYIGLICNHEGGEEHAH
jgi:F-type H+-transporting ATPase subunit a